MDGEFALKPKYTQNKNKSFYLVKFTDFAQKLLEKCISQNSLGINISIRQHENQGVIKFLDSSNCKDDDPPKSYDLNFNIQGLVQLGYTEGTFECVKFKKGSFQLLGEIKQKFSITAHENIYQTTKEKMAIADEISKQTRVKEIKSAATLLHGTAKRKLLGTNSPNNFPLKTKVKPNPSHQTTATTTTSALHKKIMGPSGLKSTANLMTELFGNPIRASSISPSVDKMKTSASAPNSTANTPKSTTSTTATMSNFTPLLVNTKNIPVKQIPLTPKITGLEKKVPVLQDPRGGGGGGNNKINNNQSTKPPKSDLAAAHKENAIFMKNAALFKPIPFTFEKLLSSSSPVSSHHPIKSSPIDQNIITPILPPTKTNGLNIPPVEEYALKDVIMHALAIRPHKRSELVGIIEKSHSYLKNDGWSAILTGCLNNIAIFNSNNNTYTLARRAYNEIDLDSNLYTDTERSFVKRKIPTTSSPEPLDVKTPPHLKQLKMLRESSSSTLLEGCGSSSKDSPPMHQNHIEPMANHGKKIFKNEQGIIKRIKKSSERPQTHESNGTIANNLNDDSDISNIDFSALKHPLIFPSLSEDYKKEFQNITNIGQRDAYKISFDRDYAEYMKLHKKLRHVYNKFDLLNRKLQVLDKSTLEYKEIRDKFMANYSELIKPAQTPSSSENGLINSELPFAQSHLNSPQTEYVKRRRRFDYLHARLSYIKILVESFDRSDKFDESKINS